MAAPKKSDTAVANESKPETIAGQLETALSANVTKAVDTVKADAESAAETALAGALATTTQTLRTKLSAEANKALSELESALHTLGVKIEAAEAHVSADLASLLAKIKAHL